MVLLRLKSGFTVVAHRTYLAHLLCSIMYLFQQSPKDIIGQKVGDRHIAIRLHGLCMRIAAPGHLPAPECSTGSCGFHPVPVQSIVHQPQVSDPGSLKFQLDVNNEYMLRTSSPWFTVN